MGEKKKEWPAVITGRQLRSERQTFMESIQMGTAPAHEKAKGVDGQRKRSTDAGGNHRTWSQRDASWLFQVGEWERRGRSGPPLSGPYTIEALVDPEADVGKSGICG